MQDILPKSENARDTFKALQVAQLPEGQGRGDSGLQPLRSGGPGTGQPEMYFFDITGVAPGDAFVIRTLAEGGSSGNDAYFGPVSFDVGPAPAQK
jgi:hypothetical protein